MKSNKPIIHPKEVIKKVAGSTKMSISGIF
ncbi:hypothetical protein C5S53_11765 [Methanophagales archaeon]|nr:hypothetical protein C5S53_11765 [Methanophagales archaeon]